MDDWDRDTTNYVRKIGNMAGANNWIHNRMASWYKFIHYSLIVAKLMFVAFSTTLQLVVLSEALEGTRLVLITGAAITASIGFVEGISLYLRYDDKISQQRSAAAVYSGIFSKIEKIMVMSIDDRPLSQDIVPQLIDDYNDCFKSSPTVWSILVWQYLHKYKGDDITYSDLIGINKIHISRCRQPDEERDNGNMFKSVFGVVGKGAHQYQLERYFISDEV